MNIKYNLPQFDFIINLKKIRSNHMEILQKSTFRFEKIRWAVNHLDEHIE